MKIAPLEWRAPGKDHETHGDSPSLPTAQGSVAILLRIFCFAQTQEELPSLHASRRFQPLPRAGEYISLI
jgi:hypothetical protein